MRSTAKKWNEKKWHKNKENRENNDEFIPSVLLIFFEHMCYIKHNSETCGINVFFFQVLVRPVCLVSSAKTLLT